MKTKLQPSQKLNIKPILMYSCAGIVGAILIGIGAFFYFNVGTSSISEAATTAEGDVITSANIPNANWNTASGWDLGRRPEHGDRVIIKAGHTRTISANTSLNGEIIVNGLLRVTNARLAMNDSSKVAVNEGGIINFSPPVWRRWLWADYLSPTGSINIGGSWSFWGIQLWNGGITIENDPVYGEAHFGTGADAILPIELVSFDAQLDKMNQVAITWATASEENNDFFTIERSIDGLNFSMLDTMNGAGNSNSLLEYEYIDKYPVAGTNYYRLKQTDYDGKFEYFKIVSVYMEAVQTEFSVISLGPNPYKDHFEVNFFSGDNKDVHLKLMDMQGNTIFSKSLETQIGQNSYIYYDQENLQPGVYLFTIVQEGSPAKTFRVVKN